MKTSLLILSLILTVGLGTASASPTCQQVIKKPSIYPELSEIKNAQKMVRHLSKYFNRHSNYLRTSLENGSTSKSYDLIIVGAGPQAASAALSLKDTGLRVLIIDKAPVVASNFATKEFVINSVETQSLSMHDFPYSPLKLNHLTSSKYASSHQLAALLQGHIYHSRTPVLLNTEVKSFELESPTGRILLKDQSGLTLNAKFVFVATGLGEATTKIPDPAYRELFFKAMAEHNQIETVQPIMNTETFMKLLNRAPRTRKLITMPENVALIGNGDGARITVEEMLEPYVVLPKKFKITWIGNNAKNAEDYVKSQEGWDRYIDRVVPFYEKNQIEAVPGYAGKVESLPNGKFRISTSDKASNSETVVEVDMIIDSTGYDNAALNLVQRNFQGSQLIDVKGTLAERGFQNTVLGRQVQTQDGKSTGVYFVGPAAGSLTSKEELGSFASRATVSIHMNIPRTSELALQLFGIKKGPRSKGEKEVQEPVKTAEQIIKDL